MIVVGSSCSSPVCSLSFHVLSLVKLGVHLGIFVAYFAPLDLPSTDWVDTVVRIVKCKERLRLVYLETHDQVKSNSSLCSQFQPISVALLPIQMVSSLSHLKQRGELSCFFPHDFKTTLSPPADGAIYIRFLEILSRFHFWINFDKKTKLRTSFTFLYIS